VYKPVGLHAYRNCRPERDFHNYRQVTIDLSCSLLSHVLHVKWRHFIVVCDSPSGNACRFENVPCYLALGSLGLAVRFSGLRARKLSEPNSEELWRKCVARYCSLLSYIVWYVDFGETYRLHLQDNWNSPTRLYDVIIHKTTLRIFTAVKTLWPPYATKVQDSDINWFYVPGGSGRNLVILRIYFERKVYPTRDDHGGTATVQPL
jgi:hypothetical protein